MNRLTRSCIVQAPQFIRTTAGWQVVKKYFFTPTPRLEARTIPPSTGTVIFSPFEHPWSARKRTLVLAFSVATAAKLQQKSDESPAVFEQEGSVGPSNRLHRPVRLPITQPANHPACHLVRIARNWLGSYPAPATVLPRGAAHFSMNQLNCMLPWLKSQEN